LQNTIGNNDYGKGIRTLRLIKDRFIDLEDINRDEDDMNLDE
jgi:hypothetical protein